MAALFPRWSNRLVRWAIVLALLGVVAVPLLLMAWARSPFATGQFDAPEQPMWFNHEHHVTGYDIDCRYCHYTVEHAATAAVPATEVCVPCHDQRWLGSPYFAPVRRSLAAGRPIPWRRVYDLPDFVFFNHAIHVNKGVGCETCHGRVDHMAVVSQAVPLTMNWCLECHMEPAHYLRPVEEMTTMGWQPDRPQIELGRELLLRYDTPSVEELVTCTACHR